MKVLQNEYICEECEWSGQPEDLQEKHEEGDWRWVCPNCGEFLE